MKFIEVKIYTSRQGVEALTAMLMKKGITGVAVQDPADAETLLEKKQDYEWDYVDKTLLADRDKEPVVSFYLEDSETGRQRLQDLKIAVMMLKSKEMEGIFGWDTDLGRLYVEADVVDDSQWKDKWKAYFKPQKVTDRLVIKPTWESYNAGADEVVVEMDPGMAFGTGTHETTSLCLEMLEHYLQPGQTVIDIGCGSGILSIAAALLGSGPVLAVDIDPDAVQVARENARINGAAEKITVQEGDLANGIEARAHIITANLAAPLVMAFAGSAAEHLEAGGIYLVSGILTEKRTEVEEALAGAGFTLLETKEKGEWCAIAAQRS